MTVSQHPLLTVSQVLLDAAHAREKGFTHFVFVAKNGGKFKLEGQFHFEKLARDFIRARYEGNTGYDICAVAVFSPGRIAPLYTHLAREGKVIV